MKLITTKMNKILSWWLLVFILTACTNSSVNILEMQRSNQTRATGIIQAINRYHEEHKQLPATLSTQGKRI